LISVFTPIHNTKEVLWRTKNDEVAMYPGAAKAAKGGGGGGGMAVPSIDLTPLINAINATTAAVNKVHAKDTSVKIDSKEVNNNAMKNSTKAA
jgi:hypothetical protein